MVHPQTAANMFMLDLSLPSSRCRALLVSIFQEMGSPVGSYSLLDTGDHQHDPAWLIGCFEVAQKMQN